MNIHQLEYIVALDTHRNYVKAAESCFIAQATLSIMIKKLEEELNCTIFDRSKQPLIPTELGIKIIDQARIILQEYSILKGIVVQETQEFTGDLRIGIIPTLAPYLIPLFLNSFLEKYPNIRLHISEITTDSILQKLKEYELDAGIMAIPYQNNTLNQETLFYEDFVVYGTVLSKKKKKKVISTKELETENLWLLDEGHCLRTQVINLCSLKNSFNTTRQIDFVAGSIETIKKIVEMNHGITVLPALSLEYMNANQLKNVLKFEEPVPVREIGLVTYRQHLKSNLISALKNEILNNIPKEMQKIKNHTIIQI